MVVLKYPEKPVVKKSIEFHVANESGMAFAVSGRFVPVRVLYFTDKTGSYRHVLRVGGRDELEIFFRGGVVYVLGVNEPLEYASVVAFRGQTEIGDVFVDGYTYRSLRGRKITSANFLTKLIEIMEGVE